MKTLDSTAMMENSGFLYLLKEVQKDVFYHKLLLIYSPLKINNFDHLIAYSFFVFYIFKIVLSFDYEF